MMSVTEKQIKALTPHHRIVWHSPPGEPVEMGLYVDDQGDLCTDVGHVVHYKSGTQTLAFRRIVRIIPPPFVPRVGMVIGNPGGPGRRLVCIDDNDWLGYAPELDATLHWFADASARTLVETHGWEVMGDLAAPGEALTPQHRRLMPGVPPELGVYVDEDESGDAVTPEQTS